MLHTKLNPDKLEVSEKKPMRSNVNGRKQIAIGQPSHSDDLKIEGETQTKLLRIGGCQ